MGKIFSIFALLSFFINSGPAEDHSEYLEGPYTSVHDITEACLACHEDAAREVMTTSHWTWLSEKPVSVPGHDKQILFGKRNAFNNFCINLISNWPRCTSCHIGYGWSDATFDFSREKNVDCLVCHDRTGNYKKSPAGAGYPEESVDLLAAAQSVGEPTRRNCGVCHFYGGGGDNIKHGDLEPALIDPEAGIDIHMGENEMTCQACHTTTEHQMKGIAGSVSPTDYKKRVLCEDCHDTAPHENEMLNTHYERIACQTCHIPSYAKKRATKTEWDWSVAGQERAEIPTELGRPTYARKKGSFGWGQNLKPEYYWFNGSMKRYLLGDEVVKNGITRLNEPVGNVDDPKAKIYPFKVHRGKQIADARYGYLIVAKLWGGYWKHYDWNLASKQGMEAAGLAYSGSYEFVETEMYWRINHEVVAKEKALECMDCHGTEGRLDWERLGYGDNPVSEEDIEIMMPN
jgi:octaheme c-type cytochrome (tetrathionate reductase family)